MTNSKPNIAHRNLINKFYEAGYITWPETKCLLEYLDNLNTSLMNILLTTEVDGREIHLMSSDPGYRNMAIDDIIAYLQICGDSSLGGFTVQYHYNSNTFEVLGQ
jgi:hypothetical protein